MPAANAAASPDFDARQAHGALLYEDSDIPQGMTVAQWRRSRAATVVSPDRRRFKRRRPRPIVRTAASRATVAASLVTEVPVRERPARGLMHEAGVAVEDGELLVRDRRAARR
jgi:hypothetical protein